MAGNTKNTPEITFVAADGHEDITTDGDKDEPTTSGDNTSTDNTTTNASSTTKPKTTKASATIKNPQTADINLPAIAGIGTVLSAAAFFIFRAKRR
jgi:LPXTG-motif cell wall-anchored protein